MKKMQKSVSMAVLGLLVVALPFGGRNAMALGVSPGAFCAQGVPVGEKTDTGVDMKIGNDTDKERIFSIKVGDMPAMKGLALRGYTTLPDLAWFVLDKNELTAPGKGSVTSRITISVPDDEKYYNQHWGVSCLIEYSEQKGLFQEAIKTVYMFETKSKADIKGRPLGDLGVAPSIVSIDTASKKTSSATFRIYNNTSEAREYKLISRIPEVTGDNLKLNASPSFTWLPDANLVTLKKTVVKIKAGEMAEVTVSQGVPQAMLTDGCKLEGAVFVESDRGEVNFVRVQIEKILAVKAEEQKKETAK
jgi:hypothetical protein